MPDPRPSGLDWSRAFAAQSLADLDARNLLARSNGESFASLNFLQMAAEKLCKAYLLRADQDLQLSHCILRKQLPRVLEDVLARGGWPSPRIKSSIRGLRTLIYEIELLSPSCDNGGSRKDNCEYPWQDSSDHIHVPAEHPFASITNAGPQLILLLKLMRSAAEHVAAS